MASLQILTGSLESQEIELTPDPMTIGRGASCDVRIADAGVSSKHAKIWCESGQYFLMDLGSTNGTFVNDRDVDREQLSDGDLITFGTTRARFTGDAIRVRPIASRPAQRVARSNPGAHSEPIQVPAGIVADPPRREPGLRRDPRTQDEVELATLRGKVAFFEEETRKFKAQLKLEKEQAGHEAAASARADAEKLRALLKQKEEELKKVHKDLDEKETYYSPAELERERKRMEAAIDAERRRDLETLQRQLKELDHRLALRGAESDTVARQLKEKDDLIQMLSGREDELQKEIRAREDRVTAAHDEAKGLKEQLNAAAGKEKELNDKLKQKNTQLAQLGKERGELVQELAKARTILAKVGGAEEAAAAVEEQERATAAMQERIAALEADVAKARDAASVIGGKLDAAEAAGSDLRKQISDVEEQLARAQEAKIKVEGQLSELLRRSGDRDQFERQMAVLRTERDTRAAEAQEAGERLVESEGQLAKIRGTYDDLVRERDDLKARVEALESDLRVRATGSQLEGDWEARYKSANDRVNDLERQLSMMRLELQQAKAAAAVATGEGPPMVSEAQLRLALSRAELHGALVQQMLEGVNNSVSLLRRNSELLKGYVEDCALLANAVRRIDYTRLEPSQQQMLVELVDQTQPDVIVRNMQGIGEENADSIGKAKKLIVDYQDAFRREETQLVEVEGVLARAQGLFHATDRDAGVRVKVEAVLPAVLVPRDEAVLFAWALLREARQLSADGVPASIRVDTDGLSVTFTAGPLIAAAKERYRDPPDAQSRLVCGFAVERCGGKVETREEAGAQNLIVTLKARIG